MRKVYISIAFILLIVLTIYSFSTMPETIDRSYEGIIYKANDNTYLQKAIIRLQGQYNRKSKAFEGRLSINNIEYADCFLSSATTWTCFIDGTRYLMGQFYSDNDLEEITFEVRYENLYTSLTGEDSVSDKLVISAPADDRIGAVELTGKLEQHGVIGG